MPTWTGKIQNGTLCFPPLQLSLRQQFLSKCKDSTKIVETIKKISKQKSQAQIGYYFGLVLNLIKQKFDEIGLDVCACPINNTQIMDILYLACGDGKTLSKMNMAETADFISRVQAWTAKELGLYIPDPDPAWRENKESKDAINRRNHN